MALICSYLLYSNFETEFNNQEYRPFYRKLSNQMVVYARVTDPNDTFVIRDTQKNTSLCCFGVKLMENIRQFYNLVWDIIVQNRIRLSRDHSSIKYIVPREGIEECGEYEQNVTTKYGTKIVYSLLDEIQIEYHKEFNQFTMYNLKNQRIDCGVVLELSHLLELVDYLSCRFDIFNFLVYECNPTMYVYDEFF